MPAHLEAELTQPPSTQDDRQAKKHAQQCPSEAVQRGFCAPGTGEHRTATGSQAPHAVSFGAVKQNGNDQHDAGGDPDPAQNGLKHQLLAIKPV